MKKNLLRFFNSRWLIVFICLILGFIPFFWFKPGYIDIGGDSTRLYFYDPIHFLQSFVLNIFWPDSLGTENVGIYLLPFTLLLALLKFILRFSYLVIGLINTTNIVVGFLAVYGIVKEFLTNDKTYHTEQQQNVRYAAIIGGLFYTLIPIASLAGWDLPLVLQTQRFVYPLIFWLILKFIHSKKTFFLIFAVFISFLFAQNFSWVALPNMVGFFGISIIYFGIYSYFVKKTWLPAKRIAIAIIIFLLIQAFQYIPVISSLLTKNSAVSNQLAQSDSIGNYIDSIAIYTEHAYQFIGVTPFSSQTPFQVALCIFPLLIIFMLCRNKNIYVLLPVGFLGMLYLLVTGKITKIGYFLFKEIFLLPGFVMFRNFYGKWEDVFLFFYALVVGYAVFYTIIFLKGYKKIIFLTFLVLILLINAWPFIKGDISNRILTQDTGVVVRSSLKVDPEVNSLLQYIRKIPYSGRNLSFPIADFSYQIIGGEKDDGAYFGPSMIAHLSGKTSMSSSFSLRPFTQGLYISAKKNNLTSFENIFPLLGIQSVAYDSDPYVYEVFATFPYNEAKEFMPKTQLSYGVFIKQLSLNNKIDFGKWYHLYSVSKNLLLPKIYIADKTIQLDKNLYLTADSYDERNFPAATYILNHFRQNDDDNDIRKVFLKGDISTPTITVPKITFVQINNAKYIITVTHVQGPYVLVFSQSFNPNWKLFLADNKTAQMEEDKQVIGSYFNGSIKEKIATNDFLNSEIFQTVGKNSVADSRHYLANAYANAWYIVPSDVKGKSNYTLILEMTDERYVYIGLIISCVGLLLWLGWFGKEVLSNRK